MVLGFKKQFVDKILSGSKIHTIREDKNRRWQKGKKIHFATGVRTPQYDCFKTGECISIQKFKIEYAKVSMGGVNPMKTISVTIDGRTEWGHHEIVKKLAKHDGFHSLEAFFEWFDTDFEGKIIHWTDFIYH